MDNYKENERQAESDYQDACLKTQLGPWVELINSGTWEGVPLAKMSLNKMVDLYRDAVMWQQQQVGRLVCIEEIIGPAKARLAQEIKKRLED